MKTVLKKIAQAKAEIRKIETKKNGQNTFSNYSYFTPSYVESLVSQVCEEAGLLTMFHLTRNEYGEKGTLHIIDIENGETYTCEMATAIPEIKATNIAQQLGGAMTYTERYMKMSAFGIIDNRLDFDTTDNTQKRESDLKAQIKALLEDVNKCADTGELTQLWTSNVPLQANKEFKDAVGKKGNELKAKK